MDNCSNCGLPMPDGYVYRAGYEHDNFRTIPAKIGRGAYCDHVPGPGCNTLRITIDETQFEIEDRINLVQPPC